MISFICFENKVINITCLFIFPLKQIPLYHLLLFLVPVQIDSQPPAEVVLVLQDTISLECSARGFPLPTFQWSFNGNPIDGEKSDKLTLSNLRFI